MIHKIIRGLLGTIGLAIGSGIALLLTRILKQYEIYFIPKYQELFIYLFSSLLFGIIVFVFSNKLIHFTVRMLRWMEYRLQEVPMTDIVSGVVGLIIGLIIAYLIVAPIVSLIQAPWLSILLTAIIYLFWGYMGISIAVKRRDELNWLGFLKKGLKDKEKPDFRSQPKILDTSVIIDGRILDICRTGFVEGPLIIPDFVLEELRHIADSSDTLKRNRGRRGLDILNRIQKELDIMVQIVEKDIDDTSEVDIKLLKLAQSLNGKVITNDYNLNKIAEFQGVPVLNVNELANAVKPVVLPGEEMTVQVIKDGKEMGQGIGYLDDGTMIVVDSGKKYVGETIGVLVTSVLQTAAGRMIFAKPKVMDKVG